MSEWFESLPSTLTRVWQTMGRGVKDRRSPARTPMLATSGLDGGGEARVVILRAVRAEAHEIEFHTDAESAKTRELQADPRCTALVWDAKANLQIRLRARAQLIAQDATVWAQVPEGARRVYGGTPPPGGALHTPQDFAPDATLARFLRIVLQVYEIETLHLGQDLHRRAVFCAPDWSGTWVAP